MTDDVKKLSLPGKEDKRAAALRENFRKRKVQAKERKTESHDDANSENR
jgi:hypothetical protein